ncbi:MAG: hypothetical protein H7Z75_14125 [Ferruginibacter sp.]|nr:hypothetical protein [Cytophagales bacterium]
MKPHRTNLSFSFKVLLLLSLVIAESIFQRAITSTTRASEKNRPVFTLDEPRGDSFARNNLVRDTVFVQVSQQE